MNEAALAHVEKRIARAIKALAKNNINGYYCPTQEALFDQIRALVPAGATVTCGGSMTLSETGVKDLMGSEYHFLDREHPPEGMTHQDVLRSAFTADAYFTGTNAVTMTGQLYNVDGAGSRVAAIAFGPERVIVVVGHNKLVETLDDAAQRVRNFAAPLNAERLGWDKAGCYHTGHCIDCRGAQRMCCQYLTTGFTRDKEKYHVLFLAEEYGC